ncbi:MAG: glutathione S-transferase family protein [Magnetococcales bacterium]|nr:glutathione S-transferase family protein [Magnetococcales bacterium]
MSLDLIYFKACPFAQRTLIALGHLGLEFSKTLINPMDKPSWMFAVSPSGQVPLLKVDEQEVLFDSSVICEYLNDTAQGNLLLGDALQRAKQRCLVEFGGECQMAFAGLLAAPNEEKFNQVKTGLLKKLAWLEAQVDENGPLFAGSQLSMVDIAFAPLFLRLQHLQKVVPIFTDNDLPKISRWSMAVLEQKAVQESVEGDFSMIFKMVVGSRGKDGFVHKQMNQEK